MTRHKQTDQNKVFHRKLLRFNQRSKEKKSKGSIWEFLMAAEKEPIRTNLLQPVPHGTPY